MVCDKCGNELKEGAQFCDKCGKKVKSNKILYEENSDDHSAGGDGW